MKGSQRWWWLGSSIFMVLLLFAGVWRWQHPHSTRLDVTVYCQGVVYFPTAIITHQGSNQSCTSGLAQNSPTPLSITVYQQTCTLSSNPVVIAPMQGHTYACTLPGSSQFTSADDMAIGAELNGTCLQDYSEHDGATLNGPCRMFIIAVNWG